MSLHYISFLFCYVSPLLLSSPSLYFSITFLSLSPSYQHVLILYFLVFAYVAWFSSFPSSFSLPFFIFLPLLLSFSLLTTTFPQLISLFFISLSSSSFSSYLCPSPSYLPPVPFLPFLPSAVIPPFAVFISPQLFSSLFPDFSLHLSCMGC